MTLTAVLLYVDATAQVCTGSFGDAVITEDFGNGAPATLGPEYTNYPFTSNACPVDGTYTIAKTIPDCFGNSWHNITDHTGNGNMMLINAISDVTQIGVFYTQPASAGKLCAGTVYEFSAWVINVMRTTSCGNGGTRPRLIFRVQTAGGQLLKEFDTGDIEPDAQWHKYGDTFKMPDNLTDVVVRISNSAAGDCGNDLAIDDIAFRPCGPSITTNFGTGTTGSFAICVNDNSDHFINVDAPVEYRNYQWQRLVNNVWEDIPNQTGAKYLIPKNLPVGDHQYRATIYKDGNVGSANCRIYSTAGTVSITPLPEMTSPQPDLTSCVGKDVSLNFSGGVKYLITGPNPNRPPVEMVVPVITNIGLQDDGNYSIAPISAAGCTGPALNFRIKVKLPFSVAASAGTRSICEGGQAKLLATISGGAANDTYRYSWLPAEGLSQTDIANPVASPAETTTYTVVAYNDGACPERSEVTIYVVKPPVASIASYKAIFEGQSVTLDADTTGGNISSMRWSPAIYLVNPGALRPVATPAGDITYTLTVTGQCGIDTARVFIKVYKEIIIPNAFSPNGDGVNDNWNIPVLLTLPGSEITVYNRRGQQVYRSTGYTQAWNGTYHGAPLPGGSYYYMLDPKNGKPKMNGWVAIMR